MIISLRPVSEKDLQKIFAWRNQLEVRLNSFNQNEIILKEHSEYWKHRLESTAEDRKFSFIIMASEKEVGLLRLDPFEQSKEILEIHILISIEFSGKGYATRTVAKAKEVAITNGFLKLVAKIKDTNLRSRAVFLSNGFKQVAPGFFELNL